MLSFRLDSRNNGSSLRSNGIDEAVLFVPRPITFASSRLGGRCSRPSKDVELWNFSIVLRQESSSSYSGLSRTRWETR